MPHIKILSSIKKCEDPLLLRSIIRNAKKEISIQSHKMIQAHQILISARDRLWQVCASQEKPKDYIERALWVALYAYEYVKSDVRGKGTRATRIRNSIKLLDIKSAVSKVILRGNTQGLNLLKEWDRLDVSFEAVVIKYKSKFPDNVVQAAIRNLETS